MARRLTTFSKLLITFLILGALFLGIKFLTNTQFAQDIINDGQTKTETTTGSQSDKSTKNASGSADKPKGGLFGKSGDKNDKNANSSANDANTLKVQLVTWGGYGPGLYFNEGAQANARSRFLKEYGFNVEFKLENDLINALNAWMADEYDIIVQTADAFPYYTAPDDINSFKPKAFMQVDWSRGGDAIIAKRGIKSINDLKGKKIAVAVPSPAQTLLFTSLAAAGLSHNDVNIVKTSDNLKAAELFRSNDIDAAVVWSPDDVIATRDVPGSKILLTTREQSHIIADIMFAKEDVINKKKDMFNGFYEGWMKGVAELKEPANLDKAAKYLAELNAISVEDAKGMIDNVYWTSHGDNLNFFGLNTSFKGQKGSDLYSRMSKTFVQTGDLDKVAPSWRSVIHTGPIQNAKLAGKTHNSEKSKSFSPVTAKDKTVEAIASKPISINFNSGQHQLTENAKTIIDLQFAEVAKAFGNVKVRIEGNTDNVGARAMNKSLSQKRAQSVANYLKTSFNINPNRFVIIGNGPDKPVKGCETNASEDCKAKNRRTEFQLIPG